MARFVSILVRRTFLSFPLLSIAVALSGGVCLSASAQQEQGPFVQGYITAVYPSDGFDVNGRRFELTSDTSFGLMDPGPTSAAIPQREALRVGVYVQVFGEDRGRKKPIKATIVRIRDDWDEKLTAFGVITRVASPGPTAMFEADGYLVRIMPSADVGFHGDLSSLAEVSENTWLQFSGKRGQNGIVEASKAQFFPGKPTKFAAAKDLEIARVKARPVGVKDAAMTSEAMGTPKIQGDGADLNQDEQLKIGLGRWHTLPADQPLQQRVHRIGMALVPAYQRDMADDNPSKIHFRFFAVDNNNWRGAVCLLDGAILVSKQTIERFNSDDQLAALVADGIACNLQRQAAKEIAINRAFWGVYIVGLAAGALVPGVGTATALGILGAGGKAEEALQEERLRIALALMHDAGFDPWQAPEAWRLAAPSEPPANPALLRYPDTSCYQFGILNLQYARKVAN